MQNCHTSREAYQQKKQNSLVTSITNGKNGICIDPSDIKGIYQDIMNNYVKKLKVLVQYLVWKLDPAKADSKRNGKSI